MTVSKQNSNKFHLVIQSNSPGELAAWVDPIIKTSQQLLESCFITICLVPCQYATGQEVKVARDIESVQQVLSPKQTLLFLVGLARLDKQATRGAVLCLGGDPFYSQLLGLRLGFPSSIYTEHRKKPGLCFKHVFYKHHHGDLMHARIAHYEANAWDRASVLARYHLPDRSYALFFLGSRPSHFLAFSSLVLEMIHYFLSLHEDMDVIISIAPTISDTVLDSLDRSLLGDRIHCLRGHSLDFMKLATCMMSLPGTNTAEAMYMGLPMVTVLPLNRPDLLALDGLLGLLGSLPLIGPIIKRVVLSVWLKKVPFISLPNRLANKQIVPEWVMHVNATQMAQDFYKFSTNQANLSRIKQDLQAMDVSKRVDTLIIDTISS